MAGRNLKKTKNLEKITMKVSALTELNKADLYSLYKKYSNWFELGAKVRLYLNNLELNKIYPNDYELGRLVSNLFSKN
jgi:nitrate reductase assembly molybdenum cofactor insertion protein NarJ